jgi:oligopeptide transport system substrate-binding protein
MRLGWRNTSVPVWMLALGAVAVFVAGCSANPFASGSPNNLAPKSKQIFNYQLVTGATDIAGMDPGMSFDDQQESANCAKANCAHAGSLLPISLVFSGLVTLDAHLAVENWDAQKIDVSPDGLTYTFHLRDGLKFSDGKAVTAADYAFSINRTLDPCLASPVAPYLYAIKDAITFNAERCTPGTGGSPNTYDTGYNQTTPVLKDLLHDSVVAADGKTLTITLGAPAAYFLQALAYPSSNAIEQSVVGTNPANTAWTNSLSTGSTGQGGSGPYYVSSWDHKGSLVLKANPYFWKQPYIQTINIAMYADASAAYAAYQSGKDDIGYPPVTQLAQARRQADFHQQGTLWTNYLGLNWKMAPFDDVRARQAFALALNKDTLVASVLHGAQTPTIHIVPQGMPGYNSALKGPAGVTSTQGDQEKAKTLWQQYVAAKCGGQASSCAPVTLTYSSSSATAGSLATAMQQMWKTVLGVNVTPQAEDFDTMLGHLATQSVQLWNVGWRAYYPDPQDWLSLQFAPGAQYNAGNVNLPDATTRMNRADTDLNQSDRLQQYQQAEQLLVDQVAWVPYDQVTDHWQVRSWMQGYGQTALGQPALDQWLSMYVANH